MVAGRRVDGGRAEPLSAGLAGRAMNRRDFLRMGGAGLAGVGLLGVGACGGGGSSGALRWSMWSGTPEETKVWQGLADAVNKQYPTSRSSSRRRRSRPTGTSCRRRSRARRRPTSSGCRRSACPASRRAARSRRCSPDRRGHEPRLRGLLPRDPGRAVVPGRAARAGLRPRPADPLLQPATCSKRPRCRVAVVDRADVVGGVPRDWRRGSPTPASAGTATRRTGRSTGSSPGSGPTAATT